MYDSKISWPFYTGKNNVRVVVFSTSENAKGKLNLVLLGFSNLTLRTVVKADYFINPYWNYLVPFLKHLVLAIVWSWMLDRLLACSRIALPVFLYLNWHVYLHKICKPRISRNWTVEANGKIWMWNCLTRLGSDNWLLFTKAAILL